MKAAILAWDARLDEGLTWPELVALELLKPRAQRIAVDDAGADKPPARDRLRMAKATLERTDR